MAQLLVFRRLKGNVKSQPYPDGFKPDNKMYDFQRGNQPDPGTGAYDVNQRTSRRMKARFGGDTKRQMDLYRRDPPLAANYAGNLPMGAYRHPDHPALFSNRGLGRLKATLATTRPRVMTALEAYGPRHTPIQQQRVNLESMDAFLERSKVHDMRVSNGKTLFEKTSREEQNHYFYPGRPSLFNVSKVHQASREGRPFQSSTPNKRAHTTNSSHLGVIRTNLGKNVSLTPRRDLDVRSSHKIPSKLDPSIMSKASYNPGQTKSIQFARPSTELFLDGAAQLIKGVGMEKQQIKTRERVVQHSTRPFSEAQRPLAKYQQLSHVYPQLRHQRKNKPIAHVKTHRYV